MRYRITLSYDGSSFCGWQVQPNAKTIQECLEKALSTLLKGNISIVGAGRTDSKVNAIGYVAHFDYSHEFDTGTIGYKLNAILPKEVVVHNICTVSENFHARFSATRREYTYFLHRKKDPFMEGYSYFCPHHLDVEAMNEASRLLMGKHSFKCFEKIGSDNKSSICTVVEAYWTTYRPTHVGIMGYGDEGAYLYFRISADRFLRNMVRAIVGSLLDVGRGKRSVADFAALILDPVDSDRGQKKGAMRSLAGESVPGHALFLSKVDYQEQ